MYVILNCNKIYFGGFLQQLMPQKRPEVIIHDLSRIKLGLKF